MFIKIKLKNDNYKLIDLNEVQFVEYQLPKPQSTLIQLETNISIIFHFKNSKFIQILNDDFESVVFNDVSKSIIEKFNFADLIEVVDVFLRAKD